MVWFFHAIHFLYMNETDKKLIEKGIYFTYDEILKAYDDCIKNKRNSSNAVHFNIDKIE